MFNEIKTCTKCNTVPSVSILGGTNYSFSSLHCKCRYLNSERTKAHLNLEEKIALVNSLITKWNIKE